MLMIAHRARSIPDQENCISSLRGLPPGVDGIEIDVRVTLDGVPVLIHDPELDRLTDGEGRVEASTFSNLQSLRLRGTNEPPPRMTDYLPRAAALLSGGARCGVGSSGIYIDIKCDRADQIALVVKQICQLTFSPGLVCLVRDPVHLEIVASEGGGGLRAGLLGCCIDNLGESLAAAREYALEVLFLRHGFESFSANIDAIPEIRMRGFKVGGSIINGTEALEAARHSGCDMVLTDFERA